MNQHMLVNYGIIRSFHDSGKSVIDTLMPFVEYGLCQIAKKKCDHYDKASLKRLIVEETGIHINDLTLTNLLKKLEKAKLIKMYDHNQYFQILQNKKIQVDSYIEKTESFKRQINRFISEYKAYTNDSRTEDEIKDYLFEVLKCKDIRFGRFLKDNTFDLSKYDSMFSFIQHIKHQNDDLYKIFQDINFGYTLCSLIEREEQTDRIKLKDFVIYLDSNFILRLLDLQEECYSDETKELFELLSKSGAKIKIFEETINEVISVIEFYKQRYIREKEEINSIIQASNINGVYGSFYRRNLTISQIEDIIDSINNTIDSLGIEKDKISKYKMIASEEEAKKLYEKKYYDQEATEEDYRYKKCRNYITIIEIIKWLRQSRNVHASCFGNSRFIFLTCDWRLYRYNLNSRNTKTNYPEIIIQESIVDNLMLFFPEGYDKISTELILSVYQSSQYLNVHDLNTFADNIKTIIEEDPEMTSYIIKVTKNIENYDDIARLYSDESKDPITGIKALIDEQRKKDELVEMEQKQTQSSELLERFEAGKLEGFESGEELGYQKGKQKGIEEGRSIGIKKGREQGIQEGEERAYRKIARNRFKQKKALKIIGATLLVIVPVLLCVLILVNVIDVSKFQINETAKWIISVLLPIAGGALSLLVNSKIEITEEAEYQKIIKKYRVI